MPEYHITFGSQYGAAEYGADPHPVGGHEFVHRDGYWTIVAPTPEAARALTDALLGSTWSNLVAHPDWVSGGSEAYYPLGERLRIIHPAMAGEAVHLLEGDLPSGTRGVADGDRDDATGRLLVTVWGDGTGEVAYRRDDDTRQTWGAPARLTPAP